MQLIVCSFEGINKAQEAKQAIQRLDEELDAVKLGNIAVLQKDDQGRFSFNESEAKAAPSRGAVIGALSGAILTALFGPIALAAGVAAGAAAGSLPFLGLVDLGFPDPALKKLGEFLKSGYSALVLLLQPEEVEVITTELENMGGRLIQHTLPPEIVEKLKQADPEKE